MNVVKDDCPQIKIAPLNVDDFVDFVTESHRKTFRITFESEITEEFLEKEFERMRLDSKNDVKSVVGAFSADEITGLAVLETRGRADGSQFGWVHFYYVSPKYRRAGIGTRLVEYSASYYAALGLTEMCLRTGEHNITAQKFYLGSGFSRVPEGDKIGLNGINELMMRCALNPH